MKKLLTAIAALALALGMGTTLAAYHQNNAAPTAKKAPAFLFVLSAKKAKLSRDSDGSTLITIKKSSLKKVIAFSDRPYRIVKDITADFLRHASRKGTKSFAKDHPNGVLSASNLKPQIIILTGIRNTSRDLILKVSSMTHHSLSLKEIRSVVITLDSATYALKNT